MRFDLTLSQVMETAFSGIAGKTGHKDLLELVDYVRDLGGSLEDIDAFVDEYYDGDGDAFLQSVRYAWSELLEEIDQYFGKADESRKPYRNMRGKSWRTRR